MLLPAVPRGNITYHSHINDARYIELALDLATLLVPQVRHHSTTPPHIGKIGCVTHLEVPPRALWRQSNVNTHRVHEQAGANRQRGITRKGRRVRGTVQVQTNWCQRETRRRWLRAGPDRPHHHSTQHPRTRPRLETILGVDHVRRQRRCQGLRQALLPREGRKRASGEARSVPHP